MAAVQTTIDGTQGGAGKQKRQSYKRERKLEIIAFYHAKNLYKTSREFSLNSKTVLRWVKDEQKIWESKKGSRRAFFQRALFPDMEEWLYDEYKKQRRKGLKMKGWWFRVRGKEILMELHPDASFQFSCSWFDGLKTRHRISLR